MTQMFTQQFEIILEFGKVAVEPTQVLAYNFALMYIPAGSPEQPLPVRSGKVSVDVVFEAPLQELDALIRTLFFGTVASCTVQLFEFDHLTHKQTQPKGLKNTLVKGQAVVG